MFALSISFGRLTVVVNARCTQATDGPRTHARINQRKGDAIPGRIPKKLGRPRIRPEVTQLIIRLAKENKRWGYLRITGEIYSKGGWGVSVGSDYFKRYKYSGRLDFRYNKFISGQEDDQNISNDFWVKWGHTPKTKGRTRKRDQQRGGILGPAPRKVLLERIQRKCSGVCVT